MRILCVTTFGTKLAVPFDHCIADDDAVGNALLPQEAERSSGHRS
ncbi:unnamed protein product [Spirodela intermedia]|uniref:Uncharacterized protein n=2 Tax=Spirodela intermedia TaxID=51605 RepID=A0ABN7E7U8_SPIIN|nr:unnamed protein product [Spirodela intermedia]CAA7394282.1 unnamed protein product [Spirodela intermedia]